MGGVSVKVRVNEAEAAQLNDSESDPLLSSIESGVWQRIGGFTSLVNSKSRETIPREPQLQYQLTLEEEENLNRHSSSSSSSCIEKIVVEGLLKNLKNKIRKMEVEC